MENTAGFKLSDRSRNYLHGLFNCRLEMYKVVPTNSENSEFSGDVLADNAPRPRITWGLIPRCVSHDTVLQAAGSHQGY